MKHNARVAVAAVLFLSATFGLDVNATPALAAACPFNYSYAYLSNQWLPTNYSAAGFRAPVVLRKTGSLCTPGASQFSATASWVGIESTVNNGISQIGWAHTYGSGYCRFWEYNDGHGYDTYAVLSRCGTDAAGTARFYGVSQIYDQAAHTYYYSIFDCGTSGWSTCNKLSQGPSQPDLSTVVGLGAAESNFCENVIMGSQSATVLYGGSPNPIEGQKDPSGAWNTKTLSWTPQTPCLDYISPTHNNTTLETFDSRN